MIDYTNELIAIGIFLSLANLVCLCVPRHAAELRISSRKVMLLIALFGSVSSFIGVLVLVDWVMMLGLITVPFTINYSVVAVVPKHYVRRPSQQVSNWRHIIVSVLIGCIGYIVWIIAIAYIREVSAAGIYN